MVIDKGSLDQIPVFQLLLSAFERDTTGILYLKQEGALKILYFNRGKLVSAISNTDEDKLEKILIARQLMDAPTLNSIIDEVNISESHGKALVERGYITLEQLIDCTKEQAQKIVGGVLNWVDGRFQFIEEPPPDSLLALDIDVLVYIFKYITEDMDMELIRKEVGSMEQSLMKNSSHEKIGRYDLNEKQKALMLKFDGQTRLEKVLNGYPESNRDSLLRIIYFFKKTEMLIEKEVKVEQLELDIEPQARAVYVDESPPSRPDGFVFGKDIDKEKKKEEPVQEVVADKSEAPIVLNEDGKQEKKKSKQFNYIILFVVLILIIGGTILLLLMPDDDVKPTDQPGAVTEMAKQEEQVTEKKPVVQQEKIDDGEPIEVDMEKTAAAGDTKPIVEKPKEEKVIEPPAEKVVAPPPSQEAAGEAPSAVALFKEGDFMAASETWRLKIKSLAATHTILLELDCQKESVFNAYNRIDDKEDFFILTRRRDGRTCYLVCWGKFLSREEALDGLQRIPAYFTQQPNPPQVVPLSRYLR